MELARLMDVIDRQRWLDSISDPLQKAITGAYKDGGAAGQAIANFMNGVWLGHPLHPVLTDVPVGAWTAALALDAYELGTGRDEFGAGADVAVGLGLAGAVGAALTGLTDWQHTTDRPKRLGMMHALLNVTAVVLYAGSLAFRAQRKRGAGQGLALLGYTAMAAAAYLGGDVVFKEQTGVDHATEETLPRKFVSVLPEAELAEGSMKRVQVGTTRVLLVRQHGQIYALAEVCAHLGGPLSEGTLEGCSVICPWHSSQFALEDGRVLNGPSTFEQPCFEVRVQDGQIQVRQPQEQTG